MPFGINDDIEVYLDESRNFDTVYPAAAGNDHSAVKLPIRNLNRSRRCKRMEASGRCGSARGGGYEMTSDREEPIAMQYLARGYHAVSCADVGSGEVSAGVNAACKNGRIFKNMQENSILIRTRSSSGLFCGRSSGSESWRILEGKIHLRSSAYRCGNGEAKWNDPQLSGHYIWKICAYGFF